MKIKKVLAIFGVFVLALFVTVVIAAPPATKYNPGETLNPTCAPGDVNCSVDINALLSIDSLSDGKTGGGSVFLGEDSGNSDDGTNRYNTAVGVNSFYSNTIGYENASFGTHSLYSNTIGYENVALGAYSLFVNNTGYANVAIGHYSLYGNSTGVRNIAIGKQALNFNSSGNSNVAIGYKAGSYIHDGLTLNETGLNNIFLGAGTRSLADGDQNEIVIGYHTTGLGSNSVVLGNDSIITTALKGDVGIGTKVPTAKLQVVGLQEYADNAAATAAGLTVGAFYRTGDVLKVVH